MRKLLTLLVIVTLMHFAAGCGLFQGGKTYDGSQEAYERHPEWTSNTPSYMTGDDQDNQDK
jgi:hypothetical protein